MSFNNWLIHNSIFCSKIFLTYYICSIIEHNIILSSRKSRTCIWGSEKHFSLDALWCIVSPLNPALIIITLALQYEKYVPYVPSITNQLEVENFRAANSFDAVNNILLINHSDIIILKDKHSYNLNR